MNYKPYADAISKALDATGVSEQKVAEKYPDCPLVIDMMKSRGALIMAVAGFFAECDELPTLDARVIDGLAA